MTEKELTNLGFVKKIGYWELEVVVPMRSKKTLLLQYFPSAIRSSAHLIVLIPYMVDSFGVKRTFEDDRINCPTAFDVRNLLRWLKVDRPDLQIKTDKL